MTEVVYKNKTEFADIVERLTEIVEKYEPIKPARIVQKLQEIYPKVDVDLVKAWLKLLISFGDFTEDENHCVSIAEFYPE